MTITTLTLGGSSFTSYASIAEANARLLVDPARHGIWTALSDDSKIRFLVAGTNRMDLLSWQGTKTGGSSQENQFPRTGLTYKDGASVSTSEVPKELENATILTAGSIALDPKVAESGSAGSNIAEVKAGTAQVKFFRPLSGGPLQVVTAYDLVRCFLDGANGTSTLFGAATGTGGTSDFCDRRKYGFSEGLS